MHKKERIMPWPLLIGTILVMLSLFIGFAFNYIVLDQPYRTIIPAPLQPAATIITIILLVAGLVMVYLGLRNMETR